MRRLTCALMLLLLAGCATPFERCMAPALSQLRTVETLIARTEADIARGYALERREIVTQEFVLCHDRDGRDRMCVVPVVTEVSRPVAIDRAVEAGKLATLRDRRFELRAELPRVEAACRARFPEG